MTTDVPLEPGGSPTQPSVAGPIAAAVLLFSAMAAVAVPYHVRSIEADIAQRAEDALASRGVAARVAVSGRDVAILGEVASDDVRQLARAAVGETWGVRDVIDRLVVPADAGDEAPKVSAVPRDAIEHPAVAAEPPAPRAMRTMLTRSPYGAVVLSGVVATEASKAEWLATAARLYPSDQVVDRLQVVQSEAPDYAPCVLAALPWVGKLVDGRIEVSASAVRVIGKSRTTEEAALLRTELETAGCVVDIARLGVVEPSRS
jgi:osmotically-inducible protein OsmY